MTSDPEQTKVHIDLPNHWATGGEAMWAKSLGDDLYVIDNVPFYAYGINYGDVVRATADGPDLKASVREVVRASGHSTLRIFFDTLALEKQLEVLGQLENLNASYERATDAYVAIDIKPTGDAQKVRELLAELEALELLEYETCEARVEGSFDDVPEKSP